MLQCQRFRHFSIWWVKTEIGVSLGILKNGFEFWGIGQTRFIVFFSWARPSRIGLPTRSVERECRPTYIVSVRNLFFRVFFVFIFLVGINTK